MTDRTRHLTLEPAPSDRAEERLLEQYYASGDPSHLDLLQKHYDAPDRRARYAPSGSNAAPKPTEKGVLDPLALIGLDPATWLGRGSAAKEMLGHLAKETWGGITGALAGKRDPETVLGLGNVALGNAPIAALGGMPRGALLGSNFAREAAPAAMGAPYTRQLDSLGLYSKAVEEAHNLKIKSGTPEQMLNALVKAGVKAEELYWMGLADHAEKGKVKPSEDLRNFVQASGGKGKISKEDLVRLAEERRVRPEKHVLDEDSGISEEALRESAWEDAYESARNDLRIDADPDMVEARKNEITVEKDEDGTWRLIDDERQAEYPDDPSEYVIDKGYGTQEAANNAVEEHAIEWAKDVDSYAIVDGSGYKVEDLHGMSKRQHESALHDAISSRAESLMDDFDPAQYARDSGLDMGAKHLEHLDDRPGGSDAGTNYREPVYTVPQEVLARRGQQPFTRSHYPEVGDNVVGHWLLHDYTDAATNQGVTFANEGQSDWRKALTKYGQRKSGPELDALREAFGEAKARKSILEDSAYGYSPGNSIDPQYVYLKGVPEDVRKVLDEIDSNRGYANRSLESYQRADNAEGVSEWFNNLRIMDERFNEIAGKYPRMTEAEVAAYQADVSNAQLRETEAQNAYEQARHGVSTGPFVGDKASADAFLAKMLLTEAARDPSSAFAAWVDPDTITGRWGEKLRATYEKDIPNQMLKWARTHDPDATLGGVHIGDYEGGRERRAVYDPGAREEASRPLMGIEGAPSVIPTTPQEVAAKWWDKYPAGAQGEMFPNWTLAGKRTSQFSTAVRPEEVILAPSSLLNEGAREPFLGGWASSLKYPVEPTYGLAWQSHQHGKPTTHTIEGSAFRTREGAEAALRELQRQFDEGNFGRPSLEELQAKHDLTKVPAIRMTDKMRASIKEKGFPLFVNPATAALPGIVLDNYYSDPQYHGP